MGSLCSPDSNPSVSPNTVSRNRDTDPKNGYNDGRIASYTEQSDTNNEDSIIKSGGTIGIDPDLVDDLDIFKSDQDQSLRSLTPQVAQNLHSNTSRAGLQETRKEIGMDPETNQKKKGFQIVVSPPTGGDDADTADLDVGYEEINKKEKVDPTLNGKISWKKVADFAALLPREVKLKLWNGVFKTETEQHEVKRISKVLRTFVMLQLTREYKKTNEAVPNELKTQLPAAVKEPSKFIASFLKKDESFIENTLRTIYETLSNRFQTTDNAKKAKYAKKAKINEENYAELTKEALATEFNQEDFLKTSFLQYMLYAFQIKLDMDNAKNNK